MNESPEVLYGRILESAEISDIAANRTFEVTQKLLESGDWKQVGSGFSNVSDFIRSIPFQSLNPPDSLRKQYERIAAANGASQRAIADSVGVDPKTVRKDLGEDQSSPQPQIERTEQPKEPRTQGGAEEKSSPPERRPPPVLLTLLTHTGEHVAYPKPQAPPTFNETTGEGISWAAWSWNPVTGCLHGCDYCYARAIAARFKDGYPAGFTPLFHNERLEAPANTTIPAAHKDDPAYRRVFVCSMADLYGRWVPDEWISQVHASMLASPQWEYLLLTKFPDRYAGLALPPNSWVGTSVDEQKRVRIAERAFSQIEGVKVKWLSLEPLREPLEFTDLSMFDWVVIGAQTETRQPDGTVAAFAPPFEWVARIVIQAKDAGCKVHLKPNLFRSAPGMQWLNEYPAG